GGWFVTGPTVWIGGGGAVVGGGGALVGASGAVVGGSGAFAAGGHVRAVRCCPGRRSCRVVHNPLVGGTRPRTGPGGMGTCVFGGVLAGPGPVACEVATGQVVAARVATGQAVAQGVGVRGRVAGRMTVAAALLSGPGVRAGGGAARSRWRS